MTHQHEFDRAKAHDAPQQHDETDHEPNRRTKSSKLDAPAHPVASGLVQRKARDANGVAADADQAVAAAGASGGSSLPGSILRKFEASLGTDLSSVRVHTGSDSNAAAHAVGAKAYTLGQDIHFGAGQFDPSSGAGQHLLAHEVAHTVQQRGGTPVRQNKLEVSAPHDAAEHEADRAADAMIAGAPASVGSFSGLGRVIQRRDGLVVPDNTDFLNLPKTTYRIDPVNYEAIANGAGMAPDDKAPMPAANLKFPEDPPQPAIPNIQGPGGVDPAAAATADPTIAVPQMTPDNDGKTNDSQLDPLTGKIVPQTKRIRAGHHDDYHLKCWNDLRGYMHQAVGMWEAARPNIDEFNVAKRDDAIKAVQDDLILGVQGPDGAKGQTHGSIAQQAGKQVPVGPGKDPKFDLAKDETDALKALSTDPEVAKLRTAMQNSRDRVNACSNRCVSETAKYQAAMAELDVVVTQGQIDEEKAHKDKLEKDLKTAQDELAAIKGYTKSAVTAIAGFAGKLTEGTQAVAKAKEADAAAGGGIVDKVKEKTIDFAIDKAVELFFGEKVEKCQRAVAASATKLINLNLHKQQAELTAKSAAVAAAFAAVRASLDEYKIAWRSMTQAYNELAAEVSKKLKADPKTAKMAGHVESGLKALPIVLAIVRKLQAVQGRLPTDVPYTNEAGTGLGMMLGAQSMGSYPEAATQFMKICGWIHWERVGNAGAIQYWSSARDQLQVIVSSLYGM